MTAAEVRDELAGLADPERAAFLHHYFEADSEGEVFLGIPLPVVRRVARGARDLSLDDHAELLASEVHEHRSTALVVLSERAKRAKGDDEREAIARFYLDHRAGVNHWDLVDMSARDIVGHFDLARLEPLAASDRVWDRRIAMVATYAHIKRDDYAPTFALAERLLDDDHHLIHKATGWMLREVGKRDEPALLAWLDDFAPRLPRTALRYSLERLDPAARARLMAAR